MQVSASLMCANPLNIKKDILELDRAGIDFWHMDIMDGVYVPNLALNFETIKAVRAISNVPIDTHLMVERPEDYIKRSADSGVDYLSFHIEQVQFPHRLIRQIKAHGMKAGVAINPSTAINDLPYIIEQLDYILLMTVEPGFMGQKFIDNTLSKIAAVRKLSDELNLNLPIQIDGNINIKNATLAREAGANIFVAGTSSVFMKEGTLGENLQKFKAGVLASGT